MGMEATHSPYMMKVKFFHKNDYEGDAFTLHDESQTLSFMKKNAAEPKLRGESKPSKKLNPWLNLE